MALFYLAAAAALAYWVLAVQPAGSWVRTFIKGLAVAPLAVMAATENEWSAAVALALCSAGDVILSRPERGAFLGGLAAFALGHVAWIWVFFQVFDPSIVLFAFDLRLFLLIALAGFAVFMARILLPHAGELALPVRIYVLVIFAMGAVALATPSDVLILGALLFAGSDAILGAQKFILVPGSRPFFWADILIWPLYWLAILAMTSATLSF